MDRISNLPDALICRILSFLPTKQAVGTSILSTRWNHLFASVTTLDFDYEKDNQNKKPVSSFIHFVDTLLFLHNASCVHRFRLKCNRAVDPSRVNAWVCAALCRKVQELNLYVFMEESSILLPADLFICNTLVVLKLDIDCLLNVPAKVCLPSLKILHLESIVFCDDDSIQRLFSSCLVLEDLVIDSCDWENISTFNISSHTLKRLTINCLIEYGCSFNYKIVVNAPSLVYLEYNHDLAYLYLSANLYSLVEARIHFGIYCAQYDAHYDVTDFFEKISNVRSLYLSADAMEAYTCYCDTKPVFHNMTHLEIGVEFKDWAGLRYLLEGSPKLENLVFRLQFECLEWCDDESTYPWVPTEDVPSCLLFHLKEIEILDFEGLEEELNMVEYCLKNAEVLKKLTVHTTSNKEEQLEITKKLLMLRRGSKECQVMIH